jgi:uncharacterized damage-inducible protein DinB
VSSSGLLEAVLRHNTWATVELIDFLTGGDPALLGSTAPGTYGRIADVVGHIVGAEQWYVYLITGEHVGSQVRRGEPRELTELRELALETGRRVVEIASQGLDPSARVTMREGRSSTVGIVLAQLVHHANEHRAQVTTILGANSVEPPALSAWAYGRAGGASSAEE